MIEMINLRDYMDIKGYMMMETVNGFRYGVITKNCNNGLIEFTTDCITIGKTYRTEKGMLRYLIEREWLPCDSVHMEIAKNQIHYIK